MKFELTRHNRGATDEDLINDLRRSAEAIGRPTITRAEYDDVGTFSASCIHRRLGSWTEALQLAGLQASRSRIGITDEELFENIKSLWMSLGRQPKFHEAKSPYSRFGGTTYIRRFGSWMASLERFIDWVNVDDTAVSAEEPGEVPSAEPSSPLPEHRTRREPSERQRFRILVRDGFRCRSCGASPLVTVGVELHVDHIVPWSKGGETIDENLATKCARCNLGKGDAFDA